MSYTSGIRKIYAPYNPKSQACLDGVLELADDAGYEAALFNGDIYIKIVGDLGLKGLWTKSVFCIGVFSI